MIHMTAELRVYQDRMCDYSMSVQWTRACYGTGGFLPYLNQYCNTQIELTPYGGAGELKVDWIIADDKYALLPSSAVGGQFAIFVHALYALYAEGIDNHGNWWLRKYVKAQFFYPNDDDSLQEDEVRIQASFSWAGLGPCYEITFDRKCKGWIEPISAGEDPILVSVSVFGKTRIHRTYMVDGHALCYAAARAYTRVLKKHGFYGYYWSTCANEDGDIIPMHEFLFLKAYALNKMDVRKLTTVWRGEKSWRYTEGTSFEEELKLLLSDME